MGFIITSDGHNGQMTVAIAGASQALDFARSLEQRGMTNILIAETNGRTLALRAFADQENEKRGKGTNRR